MFQSTRSKMIAVAVIAVLVVAGGIYATASLITGTASAETTTVPPVATTATPAGGAATTTTQPVSAADQEKLRAAILDMIKDRMGWTGADAEAFADQMLQRMENVNPNFDYQSMLNWCGQFFDENGTTPNGTTPNGTSGFTPPCWGGNWDNGAGNTPAPGARGGMMGGFGGFDRN
jgi:hypothetical protein